MRKHKIAVAGKTDVGIKRSSNQDNLFYAMPKMSPIPSHAIIVVADGMGGHAGGEIASELALTSLKKYLKTNFQKDQNKPPQLRNIVAESVSQANATVHEKGQKTPKLKGMGTTLTAALIDDKHLTIANVGDSRGYLISDGVIKQITVDHSWVSEQVASGLMSEAQAKVHPRRNVITRSIGTSNHVNVDVFRENIKSGDIVLLCSDGLYPLVSDQEILSHLNNRDIEKACDSLIDLANHRGGPDNITVVIAKMPGNTNDSTQVRSSITTLDSDITLDLKSSWIRKLIKKLFR